MGVEIIMSNPRGKRGSYKEKHTRKKSPQVREGVKQSIFYDRTLYVTTNLIGLPVEVQKTDGSWYEGILHTTSVQKGFGVVLQCARKKSTNGSNNTPFSDKIVIDPQEFVQMRAIDAVFVEDLPDTVNNSSGFMTDTAISKTAENRQERELQPWQPDTAIPEPEFTGNSEGWNQFEENERLFGVKTTWDEKFYTTEIDKNSEFYKQRESQAARLAQEISREQPSNIHVAIERGVEVDVDEEALYGSVHRDKQKQSSTGKYIPPGRRTVEPSNQPPVTPITIPPAQVASQTSELAPENPEDLHATQKSPEPPATASQPPPPTKPAEQPVFRRTKAPPHVDHKKPINDLYCQLMDRIGPDGPTTSVDPYWPSSRAITIHQVEEEDYSFYRQGFVPALPMPGLYPFQHPQFIPYTAQPPSYPPNRVGFAPKMGTSPPNPNFSYPIPLMMYPPMPVQDEYHNPYMEHRVDQGQPK